MLTTNLLLASLLPLIQAEETVLGVFIFHRHGDRTTKSYAPTTLTDLGYVQVHESGSFYRDRYVSSDASSKIYGLSTDVVKTSQLNVEAPVDTVLQNSASGFLQGLYPPVGATLGTQKLGNGSEVETPLGGYQLIPVNSLASASSSANSENTAWLQGSSGCGNAIVSSNNYFFSEPYLAKLNSTADFYRSIQPVVNGTFTSATNTFKNAYSVYDFVHVSVIHNQSSSIPSDDLLTQETLFQLQTLADVHEFNLAYNESDSIRAIAGSTLAAQIVENLNATITGNSKVPVAIQFGAYASFLSFFGLAQLPKVSENFTGVVDYASSMTFELVTNATVSNTSYPSVDDISVRFLFSNGSASENQLTAYPLFGQSEAVLPWKTFTEQMDKFAIGSQVTWCSKCGNSTGVCASADATTSGSPTSASPTSSPSGGGISKAVAGVIGAFVTLAVIFGLEALIMLVAGLRLVSKKRLSAGQVAEGASSPMAKA
ncbi:histidine acid phosphatase-like protein [Amylocarpus encephaloides]|uniref:Histidine acid phosphatase-like protein n=1 Tax=Amylocarpus encephaloides TaxID=45428 RepID=A0A9P7YNI9_9HELO|nr:histidine acid phosphatase-like protein [Amylocarpus encephaloides]